MIKELMNIGKHKADIKTLTEQINAECQKTVKSIKANGICLDRVSKQPSSST